MLTQDTAPKTLMDAVRYFSNPLICHEFMTDLRWPDGVVCPYCGSMDIGHIKSRQMFQCKSCRKQFSIKKGTIFEDSPLGLDKWLCAIWMIANCRNGISSYEIARDLGITQKSAWFLLQRIRLAMQTGTFKKLNGIVEADETFVGGKARFMHHSRRGRRIKGGTGVAGKLVVMGILQRGAEIRTEVVPNIRRRHLDPIVRAHVEEGSEIYTDALPSYESLRVGYSHRVIDHKQCFVIGNVHTNGAENFWSLLKRMLKGTYISVEPFHMFRYLAEQTFRFNNRKATDWERFKRLLAMIGGKRLEYATLITEEPAV